MGCEETTGQKVRSFEETTGQKVRNWTLAWFFPHWVRGTRGYSTGSRRTPFGPRWTEL